MAKEAKATSSASPCLISRNERIPDPQPRRAVKLSLYALCHRRQFPIPASVTLPGLTSCPLSLRLHCIAEELIQPRYDAGHGLPVTFKNVRVRSYVNRGPYLAIPALGALGWYILEFG